MFKKSGSSVSFKLRQCLKYNIPVVSPGYIDACLTKNRLLDTKSFILKDKNNNEDFEKGKIQGSVFISY